MRDFVRKPKNWIVVMIVISMVVSLFINFFNATNTNLPSYNADSETESDAADEDDEITFETTLYTNDEYGFTMPVPSEWTFVVKGGADSYVNTDGSIISFNIGDYDPTLNSVTQESISNDITSINGLLGGFVWVTTSSYVDVYELDSVDYFEYATWDLNTLVRVTASIPASAYNEYATQITALYDEFKWEKQNPVPDGCFMYYNSYGNFEFPVPSDWTYGLEDGNFIATSGESGANFRVTVNNSPTDLSSITQLDYVDIMSSGKSNYMLTELQSSGTVLSASAKFVNEDVQYYEYHQIMTVGNYQYELLFQCPETNYESDYALYLEILNAFRIFD